MIKNYFKIAFRNIKRYKGYSVINITGLAVGIAACLLLFMVVNYELIYDGFQKNYKHIYRIITEDKRSDGMSYNPGVPVPLLESFRSKFPQLKVAGINAMYGRQITALGNTNESSNNKFIEQTGIFFVEPQLFDIFSFQFLAGTPAVLKEPGNVILSKATAEKYFTDWHQALGRLLKLDNNLTLKVAAIIENSPVNSDFPMKVAVSFETLKKNGDTYGYYENWGAISSNFQVYALLASGTSPAFINKQMAEFIKVQYKDYKGLQRTHPLQPLAEIHFDTRLENFGDHVTTKATIRTLELVGLLIIVMACINFVNLSTAQAIGRSKEVGVRKVLGGSRLQLFWQMMGETFLIVLLAVGLSLVIAKITLPFIKNVASIQETLPLFSQASIAFLLATVVLVTLCSGLYPALVLSGFTPALALKNKITSASIGGISLRRGLVVLQFAISQILVIGTIVAISQMNFVRNADLGFNKDAVYVMYGNSDSITVVRQKSFKEALQKLPGVVSVSASSDVPSSDNNWGTNFAFDHKKDEDYTLFLKYGDEDYVKTYGLQLLAGRNFEASDTARETLINETLVKKLGLANASQAIGKSIEFAGRWKEIVGVVKDFNTNSLRQSIRPILIAEQKNDYSRIGVKMHSRNIAATRTAIESTWNKYYPDFAFNATFLDESIAEFYHQEQQLSLLYKIFAGLAILISCLGLYGLVSFMAVQKTKEVGIRKVLGASISNIVFLFSKEFTLLIIVAFSGSSTRWVFYDEQLAE